MDLISLLGFEPELAQQRAESYRRINNISGGESAFFEETVNLLIPDQRAALFLYLRSTLPNDSLGGISYLCRRIVPNFIYEVLVTCAEGIFPIYLESSVFGMRQKVLNIYDCSAVAPAFESAVDCLVVAMERFGFAVFRVCRTIQICRLFSDYLFVDYPMDFSNLDLYCVRCFTNRQFMYEMMCKYFGCRLRSPVYVSDGEDGTEVVSDYD